MEAERIVETRAKTLGEYIDSGEEVTGLCFESKSPITSQQDKIYKICEAPNEKYMQVIPLGNRDNVQSELDRESVQILLWQHRDDEPY